MCITAGRETDLLTSLQSSKVFAVTNSLLHHSTRAGSSDSVASLNSATNSIDAMSCAQFIQLQFRNALVEACSHSSSSSGDIGADGVSDKAVACLQAADAVTSGGFELLIGDELRDALSSKRLWWSAAPVLMCPIVCEPQAASGSSEQYFSKQSRKPTNQVCCCDAFLVAFAEAVCVCVLDAVSEADHIARNRRIADVKLRIQTITARNHGFTAPEPPAAVAVSPAKKRVTIASDDRSSADAMSVTTHATLSSHAALYDDDGCVHMIMLVSLPRRAAIML